MTDYDPSDPLATPEPIQDRTVQEDQPRSAQARAEENKAADVLAPTDERPQTEEDRRTLNQRQEDARKVEVQRFQEAKKAEDRRREFLKHPAFDPAILGQPGPAPIPPDDAPLDLLPITSPYHANTDILLARKEGRTISSQEANEAYQKSHAFNNRAALLNFSPQGDGYYYNASDAPLIREWLDDAKKQGNTWKEPQVEVAKMQFEAIKDKPHLQGRKYYDMPSVEDGTFEPYPPPVGSHAQLERKAAEPASEEGSHGH